jgi:hypothetical protein
MKGAVRRLPGRIFFWCGGWALLQGFLEKTMFCDGVFVVKLWWIASRSWFVEGRFFASKNVPRF